MGRVGYPTEPLSTRAVVKHGVYAVIPPEGRVINVIPGFEGFESTILASPKLGASFVMIVSEVKPGAKTTTPWGGDGIETFVYFMDGEGELTVKIGDKKEVLKQGGYAFCPADKGLELFNESGKTFRVILYKQRYIPLKGVAMPTPVFGNINDVAEVTYAEMDNVFLKDFLPTNDIAFDFNFHILSFEPGACHPFIETHVQEHGAYVTEGEGIYTLGPDRIHVKKEDFLFMGAFTEQATYATGRGRFSYVYSKDFNRDVEL